MMQPLLPFGCALHWPSHRILHWPTHCALLATHFWSKWVARCQKNCYFSDTNSDLYKKRVGLLSALVLKGAICLGTLCWWPGIWVSRKQCVTVLYALYASVISRKSYATSTHKAVSTKPFLRFDQLVNLHASTREPFLTLTFWLTCTKMTF